MGRTILVMDMHRPLRVLWRQGLVVMDSHPYLFNIPCVHHLREHEARNGRSKRSRTAEFCSGHWDK